MPYFKIRITSDTEEEGELLRQALKYAFGNALTLAKPRKGNNPKYAADPKFLAYGELELSRADLEVAAGAAGALTAAKTTPAKPKRTRAKKAAPATGQTINLTPPAKRRRNGKP